MPYRKNIVAGAVLLVFAIVLLLLSLNIRVFKGVGMTPLDSAAIPRLWGVCLLLLSVNLLLRGIKQRKVFVKAGKEAPTLYFNGVAFFKKNYPVILTFVMLAAYTALLEGIGFIIMSSVYLYGQILVLSPLGRKRFIFSAILSIAAAVLVDYVFVVPLGVLLPRGILGF